MLWGVKNGAIQKWRAEMRWEGGDGAVIRADGDRLELLLFHQDQTGLE